MEYIDILDSAGNKTGEIRTHEEIHEFGLMHRAAHLWIINSRGQILLQRREKNRNAYPSYWDISASGHVSKGETSLEGIKREAKEELGLDFVDSDMTFLWTLQESITLNNGTYINHEFQDVYVAHKDIPSEEIKCDPAEVETVRWATSQEFQDLIDGRGEAIIPHAEEHRRLMEYLKNLNSHG